MDVEQVGDEIAHHLGGRDDLVRVFDLARIADGAHQVSIDEDGGKRVLQVVCGDAEELVLFLVHYHQLLIGLGQPLERFLHPRLGLHPATLEDETERGHEGDEANVAGGGNHDVPTHVVDGLEVDAGQGQSCHDGRREQRKDNPFQGGLDPKQ